MGVYQIQSRKRKNFFPNLSITNLLIITNLFCYLLILFLLNLYGENFLLKNITITPSLILSGQSLWTFFTSMFAHVAFFHIFVNMFSLFFIGNFLEKIIGKRRFFWTYLISGILGGIFFVFSGLIFGKTDIPALGASGAIFGILGVLAILVPFSRIYLIAGPLIVLVIEAFFSAIFPSLSGLVSSVSNILILIMIFSIFSGSFRKISIPLELPMWLLPIIAIIPLGVISFFVDLPISNSGHLGGLILGLAYGLYLRAKFPNKIKSISKQFSQ